MSVQTSARPTRPLRQPIHPAITEVMIERLVRHFYARVAADPRLGPIFNRVITDWEPHLQLMMAFWSSVVCLTGRYRGRPVPKHLALKDVTPADFDVWLGLFRESAAAVCPQEVAPLFIERAERIAESLKLAMFGANMPRSSAGG